MVKKRSRYLKIAFTLLFFFCLFLANSLFAQTEDAILEMNRAIGQRYRDHALEALGENNPIYAKEVLERALDYADVLSDIPFLLANIYESEGRSLRESLPLIDKALATDFFLKTSGDEARLLRARLLIRNRRAKEALIELAELVDSEARSLLQIEALLLEAGPKEILSAFQEALILWPQSRPLARLAFDYLRASKVFPEFRPLLNALLERLDFYAVEDPGFYWRASLFVPELSTRRRFAQRAIAEGSREPSGILTALEVGAIDARRAIDLSLEEEAFPLSFDELNMLWRLLRTNIDREYFREKIARFSGAITFSASNSRANMAIVYFEKGRPEHLSYDSDGDLYDELSVFFENGLPVRANLRLSGKGFSSFKQEDLEEDLIKIYWGKYPALNSVEYISGAKEDGCIYRFANDQTYWAPVRYRRLPWGADPQSLPILDFDYIELSGRFLFTHAIQIESAGRAFEGSKEYIEIRAGKALSSKELYGGRLLARRYYREGLLNWEELDFDHDGAFETRRYFLSENQLVSNSDPKLFEEAVFAPLPRPVKILKKDMEKGIWEEFPLP